MHATSPTAQTWYCLSRDKSTVTFSVEVGGVVAARQPVVRLTRDPGTPARRIQRLSEVGFSGEYYAPADTSIRRPAVLVFGGSEGGLSGTRTSSLLAAHGYPALAVAYFDAPGLPAKLANIPLEYFAGALRWLRDQPGVDPDHMLTYGISRGSEAALLLGVHYPELVHGAIALVPSSVLLGTVSAHPEPVWTLGGNPLPYSKQFTTAHPADNPDAEIQVEKIRGPIFLDCGGGDRVWLSCLGAEAIVDRLEANQHPYPHILLSYPNAGHGVGFPVPYWPVEEGKGRGWVTTPDANPKAREQIWPQLLDFLGELAKS
jgi:dienelactone hydrolase